MTEVAPMRTGLPRWQRWLVFGAIILIVVLPTVHAANRFGLWIVPSVLVACVVLGVVLMARVDAAANRRWRARFAMRPAIPINRLVHDFLVSRGVAVDGVTLARIRDRWREAAGILGIDAERLRADDDLVRDFCGPGAVYPFPHDESFWNEAEARAIMADRWRGEPGTVPFRCERAPSRCARCDYDRTGIAEIAPCPECGTVPVIIRTLGDYLLISSGLGPYPLGPASSSAPGSAPSSDSP
jgi:hypothetical protein